MIYKILVAAGFFNRYVGSVTAVVQGLVVESVTKTGGAWKSRQKTD